eukprot:6486952-Amphidinium_carterae.1
MWAARLKHDRGAAWARLPKRRRLAQGSADGLPSLPGHVCPGGVVVPPPVAVDGGHVGPGQVGPSFVGDAAGEEDSSSDSVAGFTRQRADFPKVAALSRGRLATASRVASDAGALDAALLSYEQDVYTMNSRRTLKSKVDVWVKLHHLVYGDNVPPFPLDATKVRAVLAVMKASGYRSALLYLSAVR